MANAGFGLEHPLVAVRDIDAAAARYQRLGFFVTALGHHPWGTANRLVMFADNFIELITIHDHAAIAADPVGGQRFGRRVAASLAVAEGVALLALRSADALADEALALARGAESEGQVDFRRAVTLPDGRTQDAVVTLTLLPDDLHPNLGVFLCQQHRPELVWNPAWLAHANGAEAISRITYQADRPDDLAGRLRAVWGADAVGPVPGGLRVVTAGGDIDVLDARAVAARFPGMSVPELARLRAPCAVAISVRTARYDATAGIAAAAWVPGARIEAARLLVPAHFAGGVILELHR